MVSDILVNLGKNGIYVNRDNFPMWVYREQEEIKKYKRNKWLDSKMPLMYGSIVFIFVAVIIKMGLHKWQVFDTPISWDVFFKEGIQKAFIFGAVVSLLACIGQLISKRPSKQVPELFCIKCEKTRADQDDSRFCDCGGEFVSSDDVKWIKNRPKNIPYD